MDRQDLNEELKALEAEIALLSSVNEADLEDQPPRAIAATPGGAPAESVEGADVVPPHTTANANQYSNIEPPRASRPSLRRRLCTSPLMMPVGGPCVPEEAFNGTTLAVK